MPESSDLAAKYSKHVKIFNIFIIFTQNFQLNYPNSAIWLKSKDINTTNINQ